MLKVISKLTGSIAVILALNSRVQQASAVWELSQAWAVNSLFHSALSSCCPSVPSWFKVHWNPSGVYPLPQNVSWGLSES